MSKPFIFCTATDEFRRTQWLAAWFVILLGSSLIFIEAIRTDTGTQSSSKIPFLYTNSMVLIFVLVLLGASAFHQYGIAYMLVVDYAFGDYVPLIIICSLLAAELVRSLKQPFGPAQIIFSTLPLIVTLCAVFLNKIIAPFEMSLELLWNPFVMLAITGLVVLWQAVRHKWNMLFYVVFAYGLTVILTLGYSPDKPYVLNWYLCVGCFLVVAFVWGLFKDNIYLCLSAVVVLFFGLVSAECFGKFAELYGMTNASAAVGVAGLGFCITSLIFGPKSTRSIRIFGVVLLIISIFDFLPKSLDINRDILALTVIVVLCVLFWFRTKDICAMLILCIPVIRRLYLLGRGMSSWSFVVLSFVLLLAGAAISLFFKKSKAVQNHQDELLPK